RGAGAAGMVGGQVDDLRISDLRFEISDCSENLKSEIYNLKSLESLHARKTGALFRAALRMGAYVAQGEQSGGPRPELIATLDAYGRCFGQAFQITDDLLDVEGNAEQTGKRVGKGAARGKITYSGFLGGAESRRRAQALCDEGREPLAILGPAGGRLAALVRLILERNR